MAADPSRHCPTCRRSRRCRRSTSVAADSLKALPKRSMRFRLSPWTKLYRPDHLKSIFCGCRVCRRTALFPWPSSVTGLATAGAALAQVGLRQTQKMDDTTKALLQILCHGRPAYDHGYVGWGTPGLFSMLNSAADELLMHVYRGERPRDVRQFYEGTRVLGYGQAALAAYFAPWSCDGVAPPDDGDVTTWAVPTLLKKSRYVVASRLLHQLYRPRADVLGAQPASSRYAVAVHLRRGDKLLEQRHAERIQIWNDSLLVPAVARLIREGDKNGGAAAASGRPVVLLASDDNSFAMEMEASLRRQLPHIDVVRPTNEHDAGPRAPFFTCTAACIPPLQRLAADFASSRAMMISSKSNMGSFMLSYWGAANHDAVPTFIDMDGKVQRGQLLRGRHFCALSWGSRRGMCDTNRTTFGGEAMGSAGGAADRPRRPVSSSGGGGSGASPERLGGGAVDGCLSPLTGTDLVGDVHKAITFVLCDRSGGYDSLPGPAVRDGVVGLFSQLNTFVDHLRTKLYTGRGPTNGLDALLSTTRLVGYGGGSFADHFSPRITCPDPNDAFPAPASGGYKICPLTREMVLGTLRAQAARYTVVTGLLRLVLRPKQRPMLPDGSRRPPRFDLAVHVRRGDRLWGGALRREDCGMVGA